jgi:hypothetical protein
MPNINHNKDASQIYSETTVPQKKRARNSAGTTGFALSMLAWVAMPGWVVFEMALMSQMLWILSVIFSIAGLFNKPRGFAIAGLSISSVGVALLLP